MSETMQCPSCFGRQDAGLVCSDCCAMVETMWAAVPQLLEQLQVAISKQAKVGGAGKGGLARERAPINFGALAIRDALLVELALWGTDIDVIRRHPQAAEIVRDLGKAVKAAYRAIDRAQDRQYLGKCLNVVGGDECPAELWASPTAKKLRCVVCQFDHLVAERRDDMLDMAEDLVVTPHEAARYIGEVGQMKVGHQRIRNYLDRGRIALRPSHDGVKRLRLGDLLTVLRDDAARHSVQAS